MPRFSVVIPCRDAAATLPATLASLRAQTFQDWEAICVDDGSCDDTAEVIRRVARLDRRVRAVSVVAGGPGLARNVGALTHASGDLIAFLDADDLWTPDKLSTLNDMFRSRAAPDAVFARIATFADDPARAIPVPVVTSRAAHHAAAAGLRGHRLGDLTVTMLLSGNPVATMSNVTLRADVFQRTCGFDVRLRRNEDLEWLIRLLAGGASVRAIDAVQVLRRTPRSETQADIRERRRGWHEAVETARILCVTPGPVRLARAEAVQLRALAAASLSIRDAGAPLRAAMAVRFGVMGLLRSPVGFCAGIAAAVEARRGHASRRSAPLRATNTADPAH